jgi:hypothetical protein
MMLIDKGAAVGEVVTLKLTSGEELVAKLVDDQVMHYKLSHPMVIAMSPKGPALMPYLFTVDPSKEVRIAKGVVAVVEATDKSFADQFIQQTTGIAMV